MAKTPKEKSISARVTDEFFEMVTIYVEKSGTDINQADLVRDSVTEYMINHPIETEEK